MVGFNMNSFDEYVKVVSRQLEDTCPKCGSHNTLYDNTITMSDCCLDCGYHGSEDGVKCFPTKWVGMFV